MKFIKKWVLHFYSDSLYRNSFFLMLSTAIMSAIGFVYWFVAAKLYTPEQIGLTTTFISVASLIGGFSLMGANTSIIRFLPTAKDKTVQVNTAITVVSLVAALLACVFLVLSPWISPQLSFLRDNFVLVIGFIVFIVFATINTLTDSFFIAYRSTHINLIVNTVTSVTKLIFLPLLVGLGTFGLTGSYVIAIVVASVLSLVFTAFKFEHTLRPKIDKGVVKDFYKYSIGNYLAGFIGGLPTMVLPIIITHRLGPEFTAYYYMPMMIVGLLYIIPQAVSQSLFAEGSNDEAHLGKYVRKAVRNIAIFLIPGILGAFLFGDVVLRSFGEDYLREGHSLLLMLTISSVFIAIVSLFTSFCRIRNTIRYVIYINIFQLILLLILLSINVHTTLSSVGNIWIISYFITILVVLFMLFSSIRKNDGSYSKQV